MKSKFVTKIISAFILTTVIAIPCIDVQAMATAEDMEYSQTNNSWLNSNIKSGWIESGTKKYFYENNIRKIGWLKDNGKTYYLDLNGELQIGWLQLNNKWYFSNNNGEIQYGWIPIMDKLHYFNENGEMLTGWITLDDKSYFTNDKGELQTGWLNTSDKWYYLNNTGEKQTGWITIEGKKYFLNPSGERQTGWVNFGEKWCYFYENGEMAVNTKIDGKLIDKDGYHIPDRRPQNEISTLLDEAFKHLGKSYLFGAAGPNSFDCSGFTKYVYKQALGIDIGRTTYDQIKYGNEVSFEELQPGDLVFPHSGHVAIYIGGGQMIHAPQTGDVVKISFVFKFWRARRVIGA
ncbi:NlpC/P60 family protein [Clostridium paraputrificum]|uniref:C40 family peptidase n=1 Tax=Clostridium TaxID=1485 RepID=UPI003D35717C